MLSNAVASSPPRSMSWLALMATKIKRTSLETGPRSVDIAHSRTVDVLLQLVDLVVKRDCLSDFSEVVFEEAVNGDAGSFIRFFAN